MSPGSTDEANCQPPSCRGRCAQVGVFARPLVAGHRLHAGGICRRPKCPVHRRGVPSTKPSRRGQTRTGGRKSASASNHPTSTGNEKAAFAGLGFGVTKTRVSPILHSCAPHSTSPETRLPAYRGKARQASAPRNQTTPGSSRLTSASSRAAPSRNSRGRSSPLPAVGRFTMSVKPIP